MTIYHFAAIILIDLSYLSVQIIIRIRGLISVTSTFLKNVWILAILAMLI